MVAGMRVELDHSNDAGSMGAIVLLNKLCLLSSPRRRGSRERVKALDSRIRGNDDSV